MKICSQKDLIKLIKACRANGVSELSFGGVHLVFGDQTKVTPLTPTVHQTKVTEAKAEKVEKEGLEKESFKADEDLIAHMQIEDPARFEQLLAERELEDVQEAPRKEH